MHAESYPRAVPATTTPDALELSDQIHDRLASIGAIADLMMAARAQEIPDDTVATVGATLRRLSEEANTRAEALWQHYRQAKGLSE